MVSCFIVDNEFSKNKNWEYNFLHAWMLNFWIKNIGYQKGYIYLLHFDNDLEENWIEEQIKMLNNYNAFSSRKEYLNNPNNFNKSNTMWTGTFDIEVTS